MKNRFATALVAAILAGAAPAHANLLSPDDERIYEIAFDAAHKNQFEAAHNTAQRAQSKLLAKVIDWMAYNDPNSGAQFADITAFIRANPTWPQISTMQKRAEEAITAATPDADILDWFAAYPPLTVDGAMAYGRALLAAGEQGKAEKVLRAAWITGNFGAIQERQFLAAFAPFLRDEDHVARLDRLLWEHQDSAIATQVLRVNDRYRLVAQARMALANGQSNAEALVARVPAEFADNPGLIYELLHYRRTHDMQDQAVALLQHPSRNRVRPEMWWIERAVLARQILSQGQPDKAYDIASAHGLKDGGAYADAEWLSGWIALRFLNKPDIALGHFSGMYDRVTMPQSRSRAAYWAGRACDALGRGQEANSWYAAAAENVTTFYGQLAANHIHMQPPLPADPLPTAEDLQVFEKHELVRVARLLGEMRETDLIRPFMLRMNELARTTGQRALAANLASSLGRSDIAVLVAKRSEREGVPLISSGYPIPPLSIEDQPERALVLGLIRQESAFHFEAVSSVGARGLMQLMPATAERVAKALNVVFKQRSNLETALTSDPNLNVKLGSAYLNDLVGDFNGSYVLAVAAYNAGPARVRRWLHDMGDPRSPEVDPIDWIESIPFPETRNYVQRVLEGAQIYRRRLGAGTDVSLESDLRR